MTESSLRSVELWDAEVEWEKRDDGNIRTAAAAAARGRRAQRENIVARNAVAGTRGQRSSTAAVGGIPRRSKEIAVAQAIDVETVVSEQRAKAGVARRRRKTRRQVYRSLRAAWDRGSRVPRRQSIDATSRPCNFVPLYAGDERAGGDDYHTCSAGHAGRRRDSCTRGRPRDQSDSPVAASDEA